MRDFAPNARVLRAAAVVVALGFLAFAARDAVIAGQGSPLRDGKPDLSGIWQAVNTANWDLQAHAARPGPPQLGALLATPAGLGVVEGNEIPYQPWAVAKKK